MHDAIGPNKVAVITGGASGLGLEASKQFAALGMRVCIADLPGEALASATETVRGLASQQVLSVPTDVGYGEQIEALEATVTSEFGQVNVLMNNAGMQPGSSIFDAEQNWRRIIDVNMFGIIRGSQIFAPKMIQSKEPGLIINTGSKQGITTPPGDPAYNVSKAGVKAFTEALQHELRSIQDCKVEAKLFIPGFVFTPLTAAGRTEKPAGAWTPKQTIDFLLASIRNDDFYVLCPDNDVDRKTDEKRMAWAIGDIIENRPPLSRWHKDYSDSFREWLKD